MEENDTLDDQLEPDNLTSETDETALLVTERDALQMLDPLDQVYSPKANLQGIMFVYKFIAQSTATLMKSLRSNLPTRRELEVELERLKREINHLDDIFEYLLNKSPVHKRLVLKYYAALYEDDNLVYKPVYIAGDVELDRVYAKSDEMSAINIVDKAARSLPWSDKESYMDFLSTTIKSQSDPSKIYFQGFFEFDEMDSEDQDEKDEEADKILHERIYPYLKGRDDLLYLEIPRGMLSDEFQYEPVLLLNDNNDLFIRYEYMVRLLVQASKKMHESYRQNPAKKEDVYILRTALKAIETEKTPKAYKSLAEAVLNVYRQNDIYRQIALEVFLMKEKMEEIIRWRREIKEAQKKKQLELLLKRIQSRHWLVLIPASFYPEDVFETALDQNGILGIRKSGASLALNEDYYCIVELPIVKRLLEAANVFELSILEEILNANGLSSKSFYQKQLYKRKKDVVFLIINPILYFLRSLFVSKKKFIEKTFQAEIDSKGFAFRKSKMESFTASGIKSEGGDKSKQVSKEDAEKQKLVKTVMGFIFPDPSPSAKHINEIEYKSRIRTAARKIKDHPDFPQYRDKSDESIIADLEQFIRGEMVEDVYGGPLPGGVDSKGRKFTKKTYFPKEIKDYPIVYNAIREEMEHESGNYGSKDLVEYYKAKTKVYSEDSMEKIRYEERLKKEAEIKRTQAAEPEYKGKQMESAIYRPPTNDFDAKPETAKTENSGLFGLFSKKGKESKKEKPEKANVKIISQKALSIAKSMEEKYITRKKFSGGNLFPLTGSDMEAIFHLKEGTLSLYINQNSKEFSKNFTSVKVGREVFYFPKKFLATCKYDVAKYFDELVKHEEGLQLPNGDIVSKAHAIGNAIKLKKI